MSTVVQLAFAGYVSSVETERGKLVGLYWIIRRFEKDPPYFSETRRGKLSGEIWREWVGDRRLACPFATPEHARAWIKANMTKRERLEQEVKVVRVSRWRRRAR